MDSVHPLLYASSSNPVESQFQEPMQQKPNAAPEFFGGDFFAALPFPEECLGEMLSPGAVGRGKGDGGRKGGTILIALVLVSGNCSRAEIQSWAVIVLWVV